MSLARRVRRTFAAARRVSRRLVRTRDGSAGGEGRGQIGAGRGRDRGGSGTEASADSALAVLGVLEAQLPVLGASAAAGCELPAEQLGRFLLPGASSPLFW